MGLELLSFVVFWTWQALHPAPPALPEVQVVPTKLILQATWEEPASLRDETSPPMKRQPAVSKKTTRVSTGTIAPRTQKAQVPLWKAATSWEIPPFLWAGFLGFFAGGLGLVSALSRSGSA